MKYAELQVTTHYSFLRGASSPGELFEQAKLLGIGALGVVDRNSLAGIVKAHEAAKETGIRLVVGCRLDLTDGTSLLVYPTDRPAYSRLCRLLSLGKGRAGKGKCALDWNDVAIWNEGLVAVLLGDDADDRLVADLRRLKRTFADRAYMALIRRFGPNAASARFGKWSRQPKPLGFPPSRSATFFIIILIGGRCRMWCRASGRAAQSTRRASGSNAMPIAT